MGPSGKNKGGYKIMTLGSMNKVTRQIWDAIPMPDTVIARVNVLGQDQTIDIDFIDCNNNPIVELYITGVDAGETESSHIE